MDATLIRRFMEATQNVFETMLGSSVTFGTPGPTGKVQIESDVSGIIGFSGDVAGAAVIRLPMATASGVVEAFCGEPFDADHEDFSDAIGEISNMICGSAKSKLNTGSVSISCPQVVVGSDHKVQRPSDAISVVIPCDSPQGSFAIEVSIRKANADAGAGGAAATAAAG